MFSFETKRDSLRLFPARKHISGILRRGKTSRTSIRQGSNTAYIHIICLDRRGSEGAHKYTYNYNKHALKCDRKIWQTCSGCLWRRRRRRRQRGSLQLSKMTGYQHQRLVLNSVTLSQANHNQTINKKTKKQIPTLFYKR